jgi:hypothetical protein
MKTKGYASLEEICLVFILVRVKLSCVWGGEGETRTLRGAPRPAPPTPTNSINPAFPPPSLSQLENF